MEEGKCRRKERGGGRNRWRRGTEGEGGVYSRQGVSDVGKRVEEDVE